jgi:serine/threonine protein kinase
MKTCRVCQRTYSTHFANCPQDGAPLIHSEEWAEGTVVRGKYKIIQKIGEGAMGAVYKALHMHFDEVRAMKVIAAGLASDRTFVKRFEQEAILARKLQHPNAVRVDDIDTTEDGQPFIVMEYIEGKNLRKIISTEGPMPARRVSAIVRQVASALDAAQRLGIVHRDIKPENIVLIQSKKEDVAKVLDFGIAKLKEGLGGTTATSVTDTGMVVGTPPYMSPEQAMAAPGNELDGRSDIYSLGIVMYQMLTDELPIKGETALQIVLAPPPDASKTKYYTDAAGRKVSYAAGTTAEHNGFKEVQAEKDEAHQIQRLDEFVAKFPDSEMLADAYALYYRDYRELKNFPKVIEYADKLVTLGDKADANTRFQALYARAIAYNSLRPNDAAQAKQAKEAAALGLNTLNEIKKPEKVTDAAFASEKQRVMVYLDLTSGLASLTMKDYPGAVEAARAALVLDPEDGNATYQLGLGYWGVKPPRQLDAFWALARSATAKSRGEPQAQEIKTYLKKLMLSYEQTACPSLVDTQLNELMQVAGSSLERPESYTLPSKADLDAARNVMSFTTVVADIKADGETGKATWLAACGLQFPNVPSKVISVVQGDPVVLKVALVTTELEFRAARRANMDVSVAGQPEAGGLAVGSLVRFTGTLAGYDRTPLMLHWQKAKINAQDFPAAGKSSAQPVGPGMAGAGGVGWQAI